MHRWRRHAVTGIGAFLAVVLASCSSSPSRDQGLHAHRTTTTAPVTAITSASAAVTTQPGVAVPNIIGLKIAAARSALRDVGLLGVDVNKPCNKGTLLSQSVVDSLVLPGKEPNLNAGAVPVAPGSKVPADTRVGITWSGCYGNAVVVPDVVGLSFAVASDTITGAGLTWACYSVERPRKKTSSTTSSSTTVSSTSTASSLTSPTTTQQTTGVVLTQNPHPGAPLRPGATVALTMHDCPQ
jgi:beta-lactam-binding protein with PASTA domain